MERVDGLSNLASADGRVRPSFVPPAPQRELRDYIRMRVDLVRDRGRYWQRLEKLLEDALIKVSSVSSTMDLVSVRVTTLEGGK